MTVRIRRKTIIIGIHAGRSGTKSLIRFLNNQPKVVVTWEKSDLTNIPALDGDKAQRFLHELQENPHRIVGDFDPMWLWHLQHVLPLWDVRIVYLHRDPVEIADSFWSYLDKHDFTGDTHTPMVYWPFCHPQGGRDAILRTVLEYQAHVEVIAQYWQNRMFLIQREDLSDLDKMMFFLDFIGVSKEGRSEELYNICQWEENAPEGMKDLFVEGANENIDLERLERVRGLKAAADERDSDTPQDGIGRDIRGQERL